MSPRTTGEAGVALIKTFEGRGQPGREGYSYVCPAGHPTIGYGHVIQHGETFDEPLSEEDCTALLVRDLPRYEGAVNRLIKAALNGNQFDALVSFTFNLGEGALAQSTLRRLINEGRIAEAGPQFDRWVFAGDRKLPGLVRRRAAERALFERAV